MHSQNSKGPFVKNKISDLRDHLFATIEALNDAEKPMDLDRAKTIAEVAQVIVNSAKVEVDFIKTVSAAEDTGFMGIEYEPPEKRIVHKIK